MENHLDFSNTALVGLQPRGVWFSDRIARLVHQITGAEITYGRLDITFYRDDVHQGNAIIVPAQTDITFSIQDRKVILLDDVLHTGRTIRAAMDALLDFGRPQSVELMVLIDRHYSRQLPVQPDYVGQTVDTVMTQKVKVNWQENEGKDEVVLLD